jgi:lysyl-tRNA synthetase class 1
MWVDKITNQAKGDKIVINDSKTPSGRVHVGSLRGVLIHDAIYRELVAQGKSATYIYGIDDYDPMDGLPADASPDMLHYMGMPLCNIPAPEGSKASDIADHYISDFLKIFKELGVEAQTYRMRDVYRSGKFNQVIDTLLNHAAVVRDIYASVSGSKRPDDWFPLQVVCEQCGKIGTTQVTGYRDGLADYHCRTDLVKWATGCGYQGRIAPFDGNGKLPWKLEWAAKWHEFAITIEGAGKDHCTKGGSRDVASLILRRIFHEQPPLNVPYEFFLVGGAKMSSSKGLGTAARDMADLLPPELLRFLMIRTDPKKAVNFSDDANYLLKLYNDFDRIMGKLLQKTASREDQMLFDYAKVEAVDRPYTPTNFQLLSALLQLPHIDIEQEIVRRFAEQGVVLTADDKRQLQARIKSAQYWLDNLAADEDKFCVQQTLPESALQLNAVQCCFLHRLAAELASTPWQEAAIQTHIFEIARNIPLGQALAFEAIYQVILGSAKGPKAGALLSFLEADFVLPRLTAVPFRNHDFVEQVCISVTEFQDQLALQQNEMESIQVVPESYLDRHESAITYRGVAAIKYRYKGKTHTRRIKLIEQSELFEETLLALIQRDIMPLFADLAGCEIAAFCHFDHH